MPEPGASETQEEFMGRCVPMVLEDGTATDNDQAVAVCMAKWENKDKAKAEKSFAVKAVGDWELKVLAVPFGGPYNGKDAAKEYFSNNTNTHLDKFKTPLVTYYHGCDAKGKPQGDPELVGEVKPESWRKEKDGWWVNIVLNKLSERAKIIWDNAKKGMAKASSGSIVHLIRKAKDGEILNWPVCEVSIFDTLDGKEPCNNFAVALPAMKSRYDLAGIHFPDLPDGDGLNANAKGAKQRADAGDTSNPGNNNQGVFEMEITEEKLTDLVANTVASAMKSQMEVQAKAEADAQAAAKVQQDLLDAALKKQKDELEAEFAKKNRPFMGDGAPHVSKFGDAHYDNLNAGDQALLVGVLTAAGKKVSTVAIKSLAAKLDEDKTGIGEMGRQAMKMSGIKANEIDYSTYATFGDEWVGIAYSQALWEAIRLGTFVANKLPTVEIPQGMESIYLPLESTDPIFYNVAQATAIEATLKIPQATVTNSPLKTARVLMTLAKLGARVIFTGEMEEDSLIPFVSQLRNQLTLAGQEYLESALIDGDSTVSTANINDTAGGGPAATDWFTVFDGFRKSALVTTAANSRSAAGSLDITDYIETVKLMGAAGLNAMDRSKTSFIVDPWTHWKTLTLPEVLTKDVFSNPTIEGGKLVNVFGYGVDVSGSMHKNATDRKANSAGEIDTDTTTNNAYGAIVAVRWDQWKMGWRRRMTLETTRIANADSTEIVALMRVGLIQRDTEASAETYYVGI